MIVGLQLMKGVSEITIGALVRKGMGSGLLAMPVVEPPYDVTHASLLLADGAWVTLVGIIGLAVAGAKLVRFGPAFSGLCLFTLLVQLALYDNGSVGLAPMTVFVGSLQVGLTTAMMIMPAYMGAHLAGEDLITAEGKTGHKRDLLAGNGASHGNGDV